MNDGKQFEKAIKESIPEWCYYRRLPDSAQSFNQQENSPLRFSAKSPYDSIMFDGFSMYCLELKSTKGTSFSFKGSSPMIKEHQIKELTLASSYRNIIAGFIFNFRKENDNKAYFLHINNFNNFIELTSKSSINEKDIIEYGAIEIKSILKRTKYKYDIEGFIERMKI